MGRSLQEADTKFKFFYVSAEIGYNNANKKLIAKPSFLFTQTK